MTFKIKNNILFCNSVAVFKSKDLTEKQAREWIKEQYGNISYTLIIESK